VRALREAIELLRMMLTGQKVNFDGELIHLNGAGLGFTPVRSRIPIFIATHSPQVLKLSGALADGILLANMANRSAVSHATSILRESERENGREPGSVAVHLRLETCISDNEARALDVLRDRFAVRLVNSYPRWDYLEDLGIKPSQEMRDAAAAKRREGVAAQLSDDDVRASTLVGSAAHVAEQLLNVLTPEVNKVTIRPLDAGEGLENTISSFINKVWPSVEASLPAKVAVP
jgi:5,10-methylenetetrahydromethanopterin reductase